MDNLLVVTIDILHINQIKISVSCTYNLAQALDKTLNEYNLEICINAPSPAYGHECSEWPFRRSALLGDIITMWHASQGRTQIQ